MRKDMVPPELGSDPSFLVNYEWITVTDDEVKKVQIQVSSDGTGLITIPHGGTYLTLLSAPGSALNMATTFKAHGRGFHIMGFNIFTMSTGRMLGTFSSLLSFFD